ncbi:MAG: hypothetical protein ACJ735_12345 [Actinomycetes bacterium]
MSRRSFGGSAAGSVFGPVLAGSAGGQAEVLAEPWNEFVTLAFAAGASATLTVPTVSVQSAVAVAAVRNVRGRWTCRRRSRAMVAP